MRSLFLLILLAPVCQAGGFQKDLCVASAEAAVYARLPALRAESEAVRTVTEFDCGEAALITSLDRPVATADARFERVVKFLEKLPINFAKKSLDYVTPYCRLDSDYYGQFCMASDIEAAKDIFNDRVLLQTVPAAVRAIAELSSSGKDIDLLSAVSSVMPSGADRFRAVKLAGFLGLDDNGVQTDRLKADLLWAGRYEDYALLFVPLSQYISGHYSDNDDGSYLAVMLFTTRTGKAVLPGLPEGTRKTYKAFAAMYLGCKLGRDGFSREFIDAQLGSLGFFYEAIKTRELSDAGHFISEGAKTAKVMRISADYGQGLCR